MCGESSRFFSAGYLIPKYQLPLENSTVFSKVINGFKDLFLNELFVFIIKKDYFNTKDFIIKELSNFSNLINYEIIELDYKTSGQAHTVMCGLNKLNLKLDDKLIIFNIDTIRENISIPDFCFSDNCDGFLEVVNLKNGDNWSFIKPYKYEKNRVQYVTEKNRISNLCSTGLYGFKSISIFKKIFTYLKSTNGELYISPMYNLDLLKKVYYYEIPVENFFPCGTPLEYENLFNKV